VVREVADRSRMIVCLGYENVKAIRVIYTGDSINSLLHLCLANYCIELKFVEG